MKKAKKFILCGLCAALLVTVVATFCGCDWLFGDHNMQGEGYSITIPDDATKSQKNAMKRAGSYLKNMYFSFDGLVDQLEYEKFSHEDAVYAVEHCDVDWDFQALGKAKSYLKSSAFSYLKLIDQLEFEKFTHEQAVYGADNCGADWNEQAKKKAASYLKTSSYSRDRLIEQLEFEKFTHEQAVYGVEANGL